MADSQGQTEVTGTKLDTYLLSTIDNPYNPFTHFDEWYAWDAESGYHTPSYLARVTRTSDELSDTDQELAIQYAIDEIVEMNVLGVYVKVREPSGTK